MSRKPVLPRCPVDGLPVRRRGRRGPWPTYCSDRCQRSAWRYQPADHNLTPDELVAELERMRA